MYSILSHRKSRGHCMADMQMPALYDYPFIFILHHAVSKRLLHPPIATECVAAVPSGRCSALGVGD